MFTLNFEPGPPGEPYRHWYVCEIRVEEADGSRNLSLTPFARVDEDRYHVLVRAQNSLLQLTERTSLAVVERNLAVLAEARPGQFRGLMSDLNLREIRFQVTVEFLNWLSSWRLFLEHSRASISQ